MGEYGYLTRDTGSFRRRVVVIHMTVVVRDMGEERGWVVC